MGGGHFPGGPVVKILPSNVQGTGSVPGQETKIPMCCKVQPKNKFLFKKNFFKTKIGPEREEELFNALKQRLRFFLEVGKRSSHALLNVNEDASWKDIKYRILNQNASRR